jgi:hypothetical protein
LSGERPRQAKRFAVVPVSAALDPRLGNLALRVLILLASYADSKTRECYPQQATMAAQLGLAVSKTTGAGALSRAIGKLVEFGYVEKLTRRSKGWVYRVASDLPLDGK